MFMMHNNTLVKVEQQKQPVVSRDMTGENNKMLGFDCRLSSLICIEFAHRGHSCVFSCICVMCNLVQRWVRAQPVMECDSSPSLCGLCFQGFHIKILFFLLFGAHKTRPCRLFDYRPYMPYYCMHLYQHRNTTFVSNTDSVRCLLSAKLRLPIQHNKHNVLVRYCEFYFHFSKTSK